MVKIDATSKESLKLLAMAIWTVPKQDKWKVIGKTYELGLMKFRGIGFLLSIIKKWKGSAGIYQYFKILSEISPKSIDSCIEDTVIHIVNGKDINDPASAGGWSQKEIDLLLDNVTFSLLKDRS